MVYVFSINIVKLVTRKSKTVVILGRTEYFSYYILVPNVG